jgi:hypothetical protein
MRVSAVVKMMLTGCWNRSVPCRQPSIPLIEHPKKPSSNSPRSTVTSNPSHHTTPLYSCLCQVILFGRSDVHLVAEVVSSLLFHDNERKNKNVEVERTGRVDAKTRLELAFKHTIRDVRWVVLIDGLDTSSSHVEELRDVEEQVSQRMQRIAHLKASSLAKLPHILFFVVSSKTPRTTCGELISGRSKTEDWDN